MPPIPTDHDLLVRLDERVGVIIKWVEAHSGEHDRFRNLVYGSVLAAIVSLTTVIMSWILR